MTPSDALISIPNKSSIRPEGYPVGPKGFKKSNDANQKIISKTDLGLHAVNTVEIENFSISITLNSTDS